MVQCTGGLISLFLGVWGFHGVYTVLPSALASCSTLPWNSRGQNRRNRSRASSLLVFCARSPLLFANIASSNSSKKSACKAYLGFREPSVEPRALIPPMIPCTPPLGQLHWPDRVTKSSEKGEKTFERHERWTLSEFTCTYKRNVFIKLPYMQVINFLKGSGAAKKSERIKTHRCCYDTRAFKTMHVPC
ncbi:hypothetical protein M9H77_18714 [Catharanthus roseus]|uniref:Uncharacterized protein n=1 Tax=Catharanthus roseus TaxID=4058 RepID=A0ACC0B884_CATRO|nr:hypothetical protein M9H77_18714 [Catharanthus roseus]